MGTEPWKCYWIPVSKTPPEERAPALAATVCNASSLQALTFRFPMTDSKKVYLKG